MDKKGIRIALIIIGILIIVTIIFVAASGHKQVGFEASSSSNGQQVLDESEDTGENNVAEYQEQNEEEYDDSDLSHQTRNGERFIKNLSQNSTFYLVSGIILAIIVLAFLGSISQRKGW